MEFSQPPPDLPHLGPMNFSVPPPMGIPPHPGQMSQAPPPPQHHHQPPFYHGGMGGDGGGGGGYGGGGRPRYFRPFANFAKGPGGLPMTQDDFDGKRLRKSVMRKTVDYNAAIVRELESRIYQRDHRDRRALQPERSYAPELLPPPSYLDNPSNAITTKFVKTATNKMRCPIFTLAWTPEGRRLVTGASSGEFTLWNGLTFNFETILQAHDVPVRTMVWSHNDNWMVTGDHNGYVKYWQSNMNNVRMFQAHKDPVRGISFSPSDQKFVTCSDDGTLRVWDFLRCQEERVLRGHGADVKCVHWHPQKGVIVSGSKDNQQPIKLWDPKSGQALATLHAHKSTVMDLKWNDNGNWLVTASRDHLLKLFDLRKLNTELQVFRGHKKEASAVAWHPVHEGLFSSGGSDGSILFWNVGTDKEVGAIDQAHDSIVWTLAWHPLGHILCSGSNDHTIKFWTRNRPGDAMRDKYNLNTLPPGLATAEDIDAEEHQLIPGMGPDDKIEFTESLTADRGFIPGLDLDPNNPDKSNRDKEKKVPYSKPIPRNFQAQWNDTGRMDDEETASKEIKEAITQIVENTPGVVPLQKLAPTSIVVYGRVIPVHAGSKLEQIILEGPNALNKFISSGEIEELNDVIPHNDDDYNDDGMDCRSNGSTDDMPPKRKRFDMDHDHNAQVIYNQDNNTPSNQTFIPPLMAINVKPNGNNSPNMPPGMDFGSPMDCGIGGNKSKDAISSGPWQPNLPNNVNSPWMFNMNGPQGPPPNMQQPNMSQQPPSLLNMSVDNPFGKESPTANWPPNNIPRQDNFNQWGGNSRDGGNGGNGGNGSSGGNGDFGRNPRDINNGRPKKTTTASGKPRHSNRWGP